jgi:hypothetical protein
MAAASPVRIGTLASPLFTRNVKISDMMVKLAGDVWWMATTFHISAMSVQHARQRVARSGRKLRVAEIQLQLGRGQT